MAEANFEDFGDAAPAPGAGRTQRLINLAGGATSVALILGLAVWGYRLALRDVNGIPVIHAIEGPLRVAPEDPGGQIADNLGLTVNRVAADAAGLVPTDTLVLAPRPVTLGPQDIAPEARVAAAPVPPPAAAPSAEAPPAPGVSAALSGPAPTAPEVRAAVASPVAATPVAAPVSATPPDPAAGVAAPVPAPAHEAPLTSLRPMARPRVLAAIMPAAATVAAPGPNAPIPAVRIAANIPPPDAPRVADAAAPKAAPTPATKAPAKAAPVPESVDPARIPAGTRLVQLGAYDSPDVAASSWALLQARFGDLLVGKSRVVQKATSGGRDFYRLRAYGFKDDAETRRFCAALDAANAPCVPVLVR